MTWYRQTPLIKPHLPNLEGEVWFKFENKQSTGSFKVRGMSKLVAHYLQQGSSHFIASSGGNAGYSLAYVCREAGVSATIIVPNSTSEKMQAKIRNLGAEVLAVGSVWDEAHEHALALAASTDAVYVHPFDHPLLWEGHASIIDECASAMLEPDVVVVAVGGGGLFCGVCEGMQRNNWHRARILACETTGAASFHAALSAGHVVTLDQIDTIAKTLGAKAVASKTLDWANKISVRSLLFSDGEAVEACRTFYTDFGEVVEPSCGAALAPVYQVHSELVSAQRILVVVCGGVAWDYEDLIG